jgi:MFS transporter, SP family, general alpha glucoside:H+ symporter
MLINERTAAACGATLMGYAAYFFRQAGLPPTISFDFSMALYATAIIGVFISWFVMARFGRRTIYLYGLASISATMFSLGFTDLSRTSAASFAAGGLLLFFTLCYDVSVLSQA